MLAAPRDLLGENGALEQQHGHRMRGAGRGEQRQQHVDVAGEFDGEHHAGQGRAHGAAHHRRHADQRPERAAAGQQMAFQPSRGAAEDQERRKHATRGPGRQRHDPDHGFHQQQPAGAVHHHVSRQEIGDDVVTDTKCARIDQAAEADHETADHRPPHPVQRQPVEQIFAAVEQLGHQARLQPGDDADADGRHQPPPGQHRMLGKRKQRPAAEQQRPPRRRDDGCCHHGDEAARLPFEQQQFDGKQHRRNRRAEDRRHAGGGAGHQQRLALRRGEMEALREQRTDRAAGHDDGAFGAERPAAADRDRRGQRLEDCHFRLHPAAADQDRLDRFGNAVAADLLRTEPRHQPDHETAQRRRDHHPQARPGLGQRHVFDAEVAEPDQVGGERDQLEQ